MHRVNLLRPIATVGVAGLMVMSTSTSFASPSGSARTNSDIYVYVDQARTASDGAYLINHADPKVCVEAPMSQNATISVVGSGQIGQAPIPPGGDLCFELTADIVPDGVTRDMRVLVDALAVDFTVRGDLQEPQTPQVSYSQFSLGHWGNATSGSVGFASAGAEKWQLYVDGKLHSTSTAAALTVAGLSAGFHYLRAVPVDGAGNISSVGFGFGVGASPYISCEKDVAREAALLEEGLDSFTAGVLACDSTQASKLIGPDYVEFTTDHSGVEVSTRALPVVDTTPVIEGEESVVMAADGNVSGLQRTARSGERLAASGCGTYSKTSGTLGFYYYKTSVYRCWNGSKVSSASTSRSWWATIAGNVAGYRWTSYPTPTKFYYTLNGVSNAAYRYTQKAWWEFGQAVKIRCSTVHTMRVYGTGATTWAWNKSC